MIYTPRDQLAWWPWASKLPGITVRVYRMRERKGEKRKGAVSGAAASSDFSHLRVASFKVFRQSLGRKPSVSEPCLVLNAKRKHSSPCCVSHENKIEALCSAFVSESFLHPAILLPRERRFYLGQPVNQPLS